MEKPLMLRVTAEDYAEEGNHPEDLAKIINLGKGAVKKSLMAA